MTLIALWKACFGFVLPPVSLLVRVGIGDLLDEVVNILSVMQIIRRVWLKLV